MAEREPRFSAQQSKALPERTIPRGVNPRTADFLRDPAVIDIYRGLKQIRQLLIETYFTTDCSVRSMEPFMRISSVSIRWNILKGLTQIWEQLPPELQEKYPRDEVIRMKEQFRGVEYTRTDEQKDRMKASWTEKRRQQASGTLKKLWENNQAYIEKMRANAYSSETKAKMKQSKVSLDRVPAQTRAFLATVRDLGIDQTLDLRQKRLIELYFNNAVSLSDLCVSAGVTTKEGVRQVIRKGMQTLWDKLPSDYQEIFLIDDILEFKSSPTPEARAKISGSRKGKSSGMKGKHLTTEEKEKISEALKGKKPSLETRQKMSEGQLRRRAKAIQMLIDQGEQIIFDADELQ